MAHVQKFGNWEGENVPYTAFFDNARREKASSSLRINPNDPDQNPEAFKASPLVLHQKSTTASAPHHHHFSNRSVSVPKFGQWDENDPASAQGFTFIFDKVKQEKQNIAASSFPLPSTNSSAPAPAPPHTTKKCCCLFWGRSR